jgi:squalene synthase HpnC
MAVDHYENFPVASLLLPARLRDPVALIYRFAREADDFADEGSDDPQTRLTRLAAFQSQLVTIRLGMTPSDPLFNGIARIVREHELPLHLFGDLLDAFAQDVTKSRYASFPEVLDYCRRSANPVGRLLLHLFACATPENLAASDSICSALQLVNFWQDIELDFATGRVYLPQDEMQRYGVTERHIVERRCDDAWRALIGFQIARARGMLEAGTRLGRALPGRIGLEIRMTIQGGLRILEKLERSGGDMFRHRPVLKWFDWPVLLARSL